MSLTIPPEIQRIAEITRAVFTKAHAIQPDFQFGRKEAGDIFDLDVSPAGVGLYRLRVGRNRPHISAANRASTQLVRLLNEYMRGNGERGFVKVRCEEGQLFSEFNVRADDLDNFEHFFAMVRKTPKMIRNLAECGFSLGEIENVHYYLLGKMGEAFPTQEQIDFILDPGVSDQEKGQRFVALLRDLRQNRGKAKVLKPLFRDIRHRMPEYQIEMYEDDWITRRKAFKLSSWDKDELAYWLLYTFCDLLSEKEDEPDHRLHGLAVLARKIPLFNSEFAPENIRAEASTGASLIAGHF